jgi:hypothetical protein
VQKFKQEMFSHEELKSARMMASVGPFVSLEHAQALSDFYKKYAPEKDTEEFITAIIETGVEVAMLNEKLRETYGADLDDFALQNGQELS